MNYTPEVILFQNDLLAGDPIGADAQGNFTIPLTLIEGSNQLQAAARYRSDPNLTGSRSEVVSITLDTSPPPAPTNLTAQSRKGGEIKLTWRAPTNTSVKGYKLYRATAAFTTPDEAELVNPANLITGTSYTDLPVADGQYFYRLSAVNHAQNASELSEEISVQSDRTPPKATEIVYTNAPPWWEGLGEGDSPSPQGRSISALL